MLQRSCVAVILAAGEGHRFYSEELKVMHRIAGLPMIGHVMMSAAAAGVSQIALVHGTGMDALLSYARNLADDILEDRSGFISFEQGAQRGTAAAVLAARDAFKRGDKDVLILFGDTPLIRPEILKQSLSVLADGAHAAILGFRAADPQGYGRLITDSDNQLLEIREHLDASSDEQNINFCNSGVMVLDGKYSLSLLSSIDSVNAQGEFYLSDIPFQARKRQLRVDIVECTEEDGLGVNTRADLAHVEATMQRRLRSQSLLNGVTMIAPETVFLSHDTVLEQDVLIEPNVIFGPDVLVARGATIRAFCHIDGVRIGERAVIGPFARLRPGVVLGNDVRIGNFVELKKADIGNKVRINHLSYIGDATVGSNANIGAGTITCNYNGLLKSHTGIGDDAFIGSNVSLVAPVSIGKRGYIGSGSVITKDVEDDALALERGMQTVKRGWVKQFFSHKDSI